METWVVDTGPILATLLTPTVINFNMDFAWVVSEG